jgi:hypothetical protein
MHRWKRLGGGLAALALVIVAGCGGDTTSTQKTGAAIGKTADVGKGTAGSEVVKSQKEPKKAEKVEHDHSGWWCDPHGIPEDECSMCSDKVAKEAKAKGDWCEKHERAMSQCFICKPERREFYAAKHRAKLGKDPPPIEELDEKKDEKKG